MRPYKSASTCALQSSISLEDSLVMLRSSPEADDGWWVLSKQSNQGIAFVSV